MRYCAGCRNSRPLPVVHDVDDKPRIGSDNLGIGFVTYQPLLG